MRAAIGRRAHEYSRGMVWSAVGADYGRLFAQVAMSAPTTSPMPVRTGPLVAVNA